MVDTFTCSFGCVLRIFVKVFTNLRLPGRGTPRQIYICYLRKSAPLNAGTQMLVTRKLKAAWLKLFAHDEVDVDWEKALEMWEHVGAAKSREIDRTRAPSANPAVVHRG